MLLIVTSTDDMLFRFINIDDLERPLSPKIEGFSEFFCSYWLQRTFQQ